MCVRACLRAGVRACVRACVCVCVCFAVSLSAPSACIVSFASHFSSPSPALTLNLPSFSVSISSSFLLTLQFFVSPPHVLPSHPNQTTPTHPFPEPHAPVMKMSMQPVSVGLRGSLAHWKRPPWARVAEMMKSV